MNQESQMVCKIFSEVKTKRQKHAAIVNCLSDIYIKTEQNTITEPET